MSMPGDELRYGDLTQEIIGAALEVSNKLGMGFLESVYHQALLIALAERALAARSKEPVVVSYKGTCVGEFFPDIVIEDSVIVELKAVASLAPEHYAQLINYLRASNMKVGLLINFGRPKLKWKRYILTADEKSKNDQPQMNTDENR